MFTLVTHRKTKRQPQKEPQSVGGPRKQAGYEARAPTQAHTKQTAPTSNNLPYRGSFVCRLVLSSPSSTRPGDAARYTGLRVPPAAAALQTPSAGLLPTGQTHNEAQNTHTMGRVLLPRTPARYVAAAPPVLQRPNAAGQHLKPDARDPHTRNSSALRWGCSTDKCNHTPPGTHTHLQFTRFD